MTQPQRATKRFARLVLAAATVAVMLFVCHAAYRLLRAPSETTLVCQETKPAPDDRSRIPTGCDLLLASYQQDAAASDATHGWRSVKFSLCQLPESWREQFERMRAGSHFRCTTSTTNLPWPISELFSGESAEKLSATVRLDDVVEAPSSLTPPWPLSGTNGTPTESTISGGVRYVELEAGQGESHVQEDSVIFAQQNTWNLDDGRLLASSAVSGMPDVANMRNSKEFLREVLVGAAEGARFLIWLPKSAYAHHGIEHTALDITVLRVVR